MATFKKVKLGAVVDLQQGLCINRKSKHLLVEKSDLPLLRITDLINNKQEQYINSDAVSPQFISDEKTLIYTRTGQVGLVFKNRKGVVHNNCFKILPKQNLDLNFLFYSLKQKGFYENIVRIASKAAQPDLTHTAFKSAEIEIPKDLPTQTRIASVLSTYDDLIENNEKRIKALEEMAQLLYTEWFVKFKFPGHEKVKMVDSRTEYGKIPEGWKVGIFENAADLLMGLSPKGAFYNYKKEGLPLLNGAGDFDGENFVPERFTSQITRVGKKSDILFCIRGTIGNVTIANRDYCIGRGVAALSPKENCFSYSLFTLKNIIRRLKQISTGAVIMGISKDDIGKYKIIIPSQTVLADFAKVADSMILYREELRRGILIFKNTRDLLIPQLVTGRRELRIST